MGKSDPDKTKTISLCDVPEEWLLAWVEAGYMTPREFDEETGRRAFLAPAAEAANDKNR